MSLAPCRLFNAVPLSRTDTAEPPLWAGRLVRSGTAYGEAYVIVSGEEEALSRRTRRGKTACIYPRKRQALVSRLQTLVEYTMS